jgi:hypothetical protein
VTFRSIRRRGSAPARRHRPRAIEVRHTDRVDRLVVALDDIHGATSAGTDMKCRYTQRDRRLNSHMLLSGRRLSREMSKFWETMTVGNSHRTVGPMSQSSSAGSGHLTVCGRVGCGGPGSLIHAGGAVWSACRFRGCRARPVAPSCESGVAARTGYVGANSPSAACSAMANSFGANRKPRWFPGNSMQRQPMSSACLRAVRA